LLSDKQLYAMDPKYPAQPNNAILAEMRQITTLKGQAKKFVERIHYLEIKFTHSSSS
jgi:hypothetical protein